MGLGAWRSAPIGFCQSCRLRSSEVAGADTSSWMVFHSPQALQRPAHFGETEPQAAQMNMVFTLLNGIRNIEYGYRLEVSNKSRSVDFI